MQTDADIHHSERPFLLVDIRVLMKAWRLSGYIERPWLRSMDHGNEISIRRWRGQLKNPSPAPP
jgi:hypothetical protein